MQVELISIDAKDMAEVRFVLSLKEDTLSSELIVSNSKSSSIHMMGSLLSHLTVSTPEATYACGLEGSNFFSRPMFLSDFSIVPPYLGQESGFGFGQLRGNVGLEGILSGRGARNQKNADKGKSRQKEIEEELEGEENDNYKPLTDQMSRIYTSAPRYFTVIDRVCLVTSIDFNIHFFFSPEKMAADCYLHFNKNEK